MAKYIDSGAFQAALVRKQCGPANQRYTDGWNDCLLRVKSMVSKAPAADVAPVVHGCFEPCFDENGNWRHGFAKCSNCGKEYYAQVINHFGYCPNCGAKMDGGADNA